MSVEGKAHKSVAQRRLRRNSAARRGGEAKRCSETRSPVAAALGERSGGAGQKRGITKRQLWAVYLTITALIISIQAQHIVIS
jgi:hypothetical protein